MSQHGGAIAVFVKTPGLSPIKTRLAKTIGTKNAEAFHLAAAQAVSAIIQSAAQQCHLQGYYAVAEATSLTYSHWQSLPRLWQGDGGLGKRMSHVYNLLLQQYDFVILVGADIPQMTAHHLLNASHWLSDHQAARFAFAPSVDGGFWLFGGNRVVPLDYWTAVRYSEADTGRQFLSKIQPLGAVHLMATLQDVDDYSDVQPLHSALQNITTPVAEQIALMKFLETLPHTDF